MDVNSMLSTTISSITSVLAYGIPRILVMVATLLGMSVIIVMIQALLSKDSGKWTDTDFRN